MQNKWVLIKLYISDSLCSFSLSPVCLFPSSLRLLMINCNHKSLASLLESRQLTLCTPVPYSLCQTQLCFYFHYPSFYFLYRPLLEFAKSSGIPIPTLKMCNICCGGCSSTEEMVTCNKAHSTLVWEAASSQNATECPPIEAVVCITWIWGNSFFAFRQRNLQPVCLAATALFSVWPLAEL